LAQIYTSMIPAMCEILKLHIDPDELELTTGHRWTVVEKDMRRRVWWSARIHGDHSMCKMMANVKSPLPNRIFSVLQNTEYHIDNSYLTSSSGLPLLPELDPLAQKLAFIIEKAIIFHQNSIAQECRNDLIEESKKIYVNLLDWLKNLPEWVHGVVSTSRVHANQSKFLTSSYEFWRSWSLCIQYHSAILTIFRFVLVDLCKKSNLENPVPNNQSFDMSLGYASIAARGIVTYLNDILLRYDPNFERIDLVTLLAIQNTGTFLAALSRFGQTEHLPEHQQQRIQNILGNSSFNGSLTD
ncbi:hypothetical protein HK096_000508, partial [Nowakowskiella sp. JEL0078]